MNVIPTLSQPLSNLRSKYISAMTDTIVLDTVSIVPASVVIRNMQGNLVPEECYSIDYASARFIWKPVVADTLRKTNDSLWITYGSMAVFLGRTYYIKSRSLQSPDKYGFSQPIFVPELFKDEDYFSTGGISKTGSIARGLTFGNNQDVVVNSSLNLQLAGKLNSRWELAAAITDDNLPIQPEGNTQQLQDFMRVFIQVKSDATRIIAGDFDIQKPNSYFLVLQKRGLGIMANHHQILSKRDSSVNASTMAIAISRGKYARNAFQGIEGNQGPYRLTGAQGEQFIIVIAGSERVYADGRLLTRGTQSDYTIDYNSAEIVFTARMLITRDVRITVEFQYSDKNYVRTMAYVNNEFRRKNLKLRVNFFNEQDSKNQPLLQTLNDTSKTILAMAGNNPALAVVPQIDSVAHNNNEILYAMIDTVVGNKLYKNVLLFSTSSDSAYYRAVFSNVGTGKGNYVQDITAANGRVYKWVVPLNGIPQGNYEPVTQLIAPRRQQQLTVGVDFKISDHSSIVWEGSFTNNDANLFSRINNNTNQGGASMLQYQFTHRLDTNSTQPLILSIKTNWEYVQKNFRAAEFYRNPEFLRDWNIINPNVTTAEHIIGTSVNLKKNDARFINYTLRSFLRDTIYTGYMNSLLGSYAIGGFKIVSNTTLLHTKTTAESSQFIRSTHEISQQIKKIIALGLRMEQEQNIMKAEQTDSLYPISNSYKVLTAFIKNARDDASFSYDMQASRRWDSKIAVNALAPYSFADQGKIVAAFKNKMHRIALGAQYRDLSFINDTLKFNNEITILSRLDYSLNILHGGIAFNASYETGNGRELKKEYVFLETAAGQGTYTWIDYNNNGEKELNEFEIAQFTDQANYIKVLLPTNTYIKAYSNAFTAVLMLNGGALIKGDKKIARLGKKFSNQLAVKTDNKITGNKNNRGYNPFYFDVLDTTLVITNGSTRNNLSFNKSSAVWDADYLYTRAQTKNLLNTGYEYRIRESHAINSRINFSPQFTLITKGEVADNNNKSEFFVSRNYKLSSQKISTSLSFQYKSTFSVSLNYLLAAKSNASEVHEKLRQNDIGVEGRISGLRKGNLSAQIHFINLQYNAVENTPLAYEMLEGLRTGNNTTWNINFQQNVSKSLQVTAGYEGRKSPGVKTVHVGNMTARAFF